MPDLLSFSPTGFQFAWDSTSLKSYAKCPRYYEYKHVYGWQSNSLSVHLRFGGIYAKALEDFHKLVALGATDLEATISVVRAALVSTWDYETNLPWESLHNLKTRETLIRTIVWYLDHFATEGDPTPTVILPDGTAAVEYSFAVPLDAEYIYCGHIDRLVEYSGGVYVQDQKTTGTTVTPKFFADFTPDFQMSGYTWAGKIIFNIPVAGVMIDAAQIAVGFTRFSRGFAHRPPQMLQEWHATVVQIIDAARISHESGVYTPNYEACGNYGGCEFRKVCSRIPQHRDNVLAAEFYRGERWDPLKRR